MADADITRILASSNGEHLSRDDADRVFAASYDALRAIAANRIRGEREDHTLQPTALLNEAYLRLIDPTEIQWNDRAHFFAIAARAMRQVLIDHARKHGAEKRGGSRQRVLIEEDALASPGRDLDTVELEDALSKLAARHARMARVVELRVFGGLTGAEIGAELGVSRKTVADDWRVAAMWLRAELAGDGAEG